MSASTTTTAARRSSPGTTSRTPAGRRQLFVWSAAGGHAAAHERHAEHRPAEPRRRRRRRRRGHGLEQRRPGRGAPRARRRRFGPATTLAADVDLGPRRGGRARRPRGRGLDATGQLQIADAEGAGNLGAPQSIALPPAPDGATPFVDGIQTAATPSGRVVFAAQHDPRPRRRAQRGQARRRLRLGAGCRRARPGDRRSRRPPSPGVPALIARAEIVFLAWTETRVGEQGAAHHARRALRPGRRGADDDLHQPRPQPRLRRGRPRAAGAARHRDPRLLPPEPLGAHLHGHLRPERPRAAAPRWSPSARTPTSRARSRAAGSLLAWTRKLGAANTSYRVQTATP